jgi:branched-chain amino acid transport system substrate-binding protein
VPFLGADLLAALKFGLREAGLESELMTDFAGYNAEPKVILPKVQDLLIARQADCVVAPLNVSLMETLAGQFQSQQVPLIALSLGEDPLFDSARNPYVFVNSFQLWQAAWMCGYLGAQRFGTRAATLVSLHESGYGLTFAFQLGLEAANGTLLQTVVTHRDSSTEDPSTAIAEIAAREPDFIWAAYSGKEAASFLAAYDASGHKQRIPMLGLPPLADQHVRKAAGDAAIGTAFISPGSRNAQMNSMNSALAQDIGRLPHPYAVLAYEAARLIAAAAALDGSHKSSAQALRQAEFNGPRGATAFDNGTEPEMAFCLHHLTSGNDSIEEVNAPPLLAEQAFLARRKLVKHGWINPYLCA